jgi:7-cyano-7-deazaguanine synthase
MKERTDDCYERSSEPRADRMRKMGVVLLSGGLDSTTVAAHAKAAGYELVALTFNYGQRHSRELEAAKVVAGILEMQHEVVDLPVMKKVSWYSALTSRSLDVPRDRTMGDPAQDIPVTYVPLRNTVFLTLGAALLESQVLSLIEYGHIDPKDILASVFMAANAVDYSGYPDCRPEYFRAMQLALVEGSKLGKQYGVSIGVETPVLRMTKAEIVKLGVELAAPFEHTWSCYEGGDVPCGYCDSCVLRAKGFAEAGIKDPLLERLRREGKIAEGQ